MLHLLAQADPSPAALAEWLKVVFYLLGGIGAAVGIAVGIKALRAKEAETPQPLVIKEHKEFLARGEFQAHQEKLDKELARHAARRAEIYEEQKVQAARLATLESETKNQTATLDNIVAEQKSIRHEIRTDNQAVQSRLGDVFTKLGEIAGEMRANRK